MDLSPILIAALVPFVTLAFGIHGHRFMWIPVTVTFPLSGLVVLAATNGKAGSAGLFIVLCGAVAVIAIFGWIRWAAHFGPVRRDRRASLAALAIWSAACLGGVVAAERADTPLAGSVLGYGVVGLLGAALALFASRDDRGWGVALISFGLASAIVVPQSAATFGTWRWGLVVLDVGVVACGALAILAGRRSWRAIRRLDADREAAANQQSVEAP